jgi:hypothetical protein
MTLQLWMQIVGKIRLSLAPWLNHSWQVPLYVTARGLGTSPIPAGDEILEIEFDFVSHRLTGRTSHGQEAAFPLEPMTVADFYGRIQSLLEDLAVAVVINPLPSELADGIPFSEDRTHAAYDADAARRFWRVLISNGPSIQIVSNRLPWQSQPDAFFLGRFRSGGDTLLRPPRATASGRHSRFVRPRDAGGLFARGQQCRFLAG